MEFKTFCVSWSNIYSSLFFFFQPLFQIQQLPFTSNGQQVLQQVFQLPAAGTVEDNQEVGDGS